MNKKFSKILAFLTFTLLVFLISPRQVLACNSANCDPETPTTCTLPQCNDCSWCHPDVYNPVLPDELSRTPGPTFLQNILQLGIRLVFIVGAIIFFFMLLIGGIRWISAGGDKARLEGAQKQITHALAGLAILLSTFAIIGLVGYLFGIDLLKITLPTL